MNARAVDPKLLYSLELRFHAAATALDLYFGKGTGDRNPLAVVLGAYLIAVLEMHREQRERGNNEDDSLNAFRKEAQERHEEMREWLVMLSNTVRELNTGEVIKQVSKAIDALTVEVSAVTVAINSASL